MGKAGEEMNNKITNYGYAWVIVDCTWETIRGVYNTKADAMADNSCKKCKVVEVKLVPLQKARLVRK